MEKRKLNLTASAKKRRKLSQDATRGQSRVAIGALQFQRWKEVQSDLELKSHQAVATYLLDSYFEHRDKARPSTSSQLAITTPTHDRKVQPQTLQPTVPSTLSMTTSTPAHDRRVQALMETEVSSVDSDSSGRNLTGVDTLSESSEQEQQKSLKFEVLRSGRRSVKKTSSSFVDPFELSIDVTLESKEDLEDSDSDYELPDYSIEAVLPEEINRRAEAVTFEEMELGMDHVDDDDHEIEYLEEDVPESGPTIISSEDDCVRLIEDTTCLVFFQQLLDLATSSRSLCRECKRPVKVKHDFVGSAVYLKWICVMGHITRKWCSQPVLTRLNRRVNSGDFLTALAIVTSGNNFGKVALLARFLNLKFLSAHTFHGIQRTYIVPSVDRIWDRHQEDVTTEFTDQDLIILGDGRMDTPGHSAQYCTYTVMENDSKKIVSIQCLDKRQTERKSGNMEKKGFQQAMEEINTKGLKVTEVVTDAHLGIGALMKSQFPQMKHSNDVWHAAKNLGKKILQAGQKKECGILQKWAKDIVNHLWFSCQTANTYPEFMSIWRGVLHHVTNQHRWVLSHGDGVNHCLHGPLSEVDRTKPWLDRSKDAVALSVLTGVVLDKRFLNRIHYLLNFRSTADLENFNQLVLMYCAKRHAYSPPVYRIRNRLAALDHNHNVQRPPKKNKQGEIIYQRCFNKKSARWSVRPVKVAKNYDHVQQVTLEALKIRLDDKVGMRRKKELEEDDPRRIDANIAPVPPPPTSQLVAEQVTRFDKS